MKKLYANYIDSFQGLSKEVWWLALITLINRAGTMVIPFLSLYLTQDLMFSPTSVGIIMSCFGIGSIIGAWLGGILTDAFGYYKVMFCSLIATGALFISLQFLTDYWSVCLGVLILMIAADAFRPASIVALNAYSKPENKTRSVTLIRLAINLGFSAGPAIGGIIISTINYQGLFWADGITCIIAGTLLLLVLQPKKVKVMDEIKNENPKSAYKDMPYWLFVTSMIFFGFSFVQYFSTIPIYYNDVHSLSEFKIGILLAMNGLIIFLFEMPFIRYLEKKSWSKITHVIIGLVLLCMSFVVLNLFSWVGVLVVGMLLMTIGEMIAFPFSNAFAMDRAKRGKQGQYIALYFISFSISHSLAHYFGMKSIEEFGFEITWYGVAITCLLGILLLLLLKKVLKKEQITSI